MHSQNDEIAAKGIGAADDFGEWLAADDQLFQFHSGRVKRRHLPLKRGRAEGELLVAHGGREAVVDDVHYLHCRAVLRGKREAALQGAVRARREIGSDRDLFY